MKDSTALTLCLVSTFILPALILGLSIISVVALRYHYVYDYEVIVNIEGNLVYEGPAMCVQYETAGNATTVRIMKPFLYCSVFQEREYVSDKVSVIPKETIK